MDCLNNNRRTVMPQLLSCAAAVHSRWPECVLYTSYASDALPTRIQPCRDVRSSVDRSVWTPASPVWVNNMRPRAESDVDGHRFFLHRTILERRWRGRENGDTDE